MERMLRRQLGEVAQEFVEGEEEGVEWLGEVILWTDIGEKGVDLGGEKWMCIVSGGLEENTDL